MTRMNLRGAEKAPRNVPSPSAGRANKGGSFDPLRVCFDGSEGYRGLVRHGQYTITRYGHVDRETSPDGGERWYGTPACSFHEVTEDLGGCNHGP